MPVRKREGKRPIAPRESMFTAQFWDKLALGEFASTRCSYCDTLMFPPRPHCSTCWSKEISWESLSGKGKLYARTTVHVAPNLFANQIPYDIGIIDLDEGIRLLATLIDDDQKINNDEPVQLLVLAYDDGPLFAASNYKKIKF